MEAAQIKKTLAKVKFHASVLWRGFCRTVYGAAVAGLIAIATFGFVSVSKESGWTSVCVFIGSFILLVEAFGDMYLMGRKKKSRSGKRERR